jgi:hypothetical protein
LTKRTSAAKAAAIFSTFYGTAEAVPLSKTLKLIRCRIFLQHSKPNKKQPNGCFSALGEANMQPGGCLWQMTGLRSKLS